MLPSADPNRIRYPEFKKHFGQIIKILDGLNSNKTPKDLLQNLADKLNISVETVRDWAKGYRLPTLERMEVLLSFIHQRGPVPREMMVALIKATPYSSLLARLDEFAPPNISRKDRETHNQNTSHNLPKRPPLFQSREGDLKKLLTLLHPDHRATGVVIYGLGGIGKTSLAIETGYACLDHFTYDTSQYKAVVFTSARDHRLSLEEVLNQIGRTLEDEAIPRKGHDEIEEKKKLVRALLHRKRVLLIVDNYENIQVPALTRFLLEEVPAPSKVLITARQYAPELTQGTWHHELKGLSDAESLVLIRAWAEENAIEAISQTQDDDLAPLLKVTGGNPYAIKASLGLISLGHQPFTVVLRDLWEGRGDIFNYLFTKIWDLLTEDEKNVLMAIPQFSTPACISALGATAGVYGYVLETSLRRLAEAFLVMDNGEKDENTRRYRVHSLVRAFATARLKEQTSLENLFQQRRQKWYVDFLEQHARNDWPEFAILDDEYGNIVAVIEVFLETDSSLAAKCIYNFWHYLYVRGHWAQCIQYLSRGVSCEVQSPEKLSPLGYYFYIQLNWLRVHLGNIHEAIEALKTVELSSDDPFNTLIVSDLLQITGQAYISTHNYDLAESSLMKNMELIKKTGDAEDEVSTYYYLGRIKIARQEYKEAVSLYRSIILKAEAIPWHRGASYCMYRLAEGLIHLQNYSEAERLLNKIDALSKQWKDPQLQANILFGYAQLFIFKNMKADAHRLAENARELYQKLGAFFETKEVTEFIKTLTDQF